MNRENDLMHHIFFLLNLNLNLFLILDTDEHGETRINTEGFNNKKGTYNARPVKISFSYGQNLNCLVGIMPRKNSF